MKKKLLTIVVGLAAALLSAATANAACWQWSKTASNNATADPSINWSEGMSPSSVNDSARAMMARLAECRDDWSGALTTGGSASAYTLTTNQGLPDSPTAPIDGQMVAFFANATNANAATLQVDGGNAYPLQISSGVAIPPGTMVVGSPYRVSFRASASAWVLEGVYGSPYSVALGALMWSTSDTPPNSNFVLPAGQCISRTTYAAYFAIVGTKFGACDGTTTFGVPDLRGRGVAALDNLNGTPANRMTSAANGCGVAFTSVGAVCGNESQTLTIAQMPSHSHPNTLSDPGHSHIYNNSVGSSCCWQPGGEGLPIVSTSAFTQAAFTNISINNALQGGGTAHPIVQPTMAMTVFLRIL